MNSLLQKIYISYQDLMKDPKYLLEILTAIDQNHNLQESQLPLIFFPQNVHGDLPTTDINENYIAFAIFHDSDTKHSLSTQMIKEFVTWCEYVEADHQVSLLIVCGYGQTFSSGGHLGEMHEAKGMFKATQSQYALDMIHSYEQSIQRIPKILESMTTLTLAWINGIAVGAGMDLANMCDFRFATQKAKMGSVFPKISLISGDGGYYFLLKILGRHQWDIILEMITSGQIYDAKELEEKGFFSKKVAMDLQESAQQLFLFIQSIHSAMTQPLIMRAMKEALMMAEKLPDLQSYLRYCATLQSLMHQTPDHQKSLENFFKK